jgi:hypothetical protein
MQADENTMWVVYQTAATQRHPGRNAVCTQTEWEEKKRVNPGLNTLIREGITNEGVAERLARDLQAPPTPTAAARQPSPPAPPAG